MPTEPLTPKRLRGVVQMAVVDALKAAPGLDWRYTPGKPEGTQIDVRGTMSLTSYTAHVQLAVTEAMERLGLATEGVPFDEL